MKKYGFLLAALFLVGCSTEKTDEAEAPAPASSEASSMMESSAAESSESDKNSSESASIESSESANEDANDDTEATEQDLIGAETVSDASDYPELEYAQKKVDFSGLDGYIVADNPNKRVVIFKDNQEQVYKTIFIKRNNYLKVINLGGEGLILNESIQ
ncbi:MAG: hypothetical protein L0K82_07725 [Pisciglobus halotolerans]|nr:hypothetical protein [Pisciglobus halotolerans]